jgi:tetratricopeptide (TPR) repeat protein
VNSGPVTVRREPVVFPTYEPLAPDLNPMFLEKRVYQGSSGAIYPLPFFNRIADRPTPRAWDAVHLENEFIRVLILPEIGGRIHAGEDKTNGYDFFYRQNVIKPALVGLAGPWISGGVEFNWPQHHRPATFMRVDVEIEHHADGSITVWCGDHDPLARMKGMHGVCLHPGRSCIELKVRAYNRTPLVQTFLWWANVATLVHEGYQSFFPPDVQHVADHARRSMSTFPLCDDRYYGVDYAKRARDGVPADEVPTAFVPPHAGGRAPVDYAPNDLSFYANIPVPTSYMCTGTRGSFFGGYDHFARAGVVHVANRHISPGKKQWTWGNHAFGYAWDRNLTDADGPYIELMAGVYTDNQPDFSFLLPGETKDWSQFWYPIREIGPAHEANLDAAVHLSLAQRTARIGVSVTRVVPGAVIKLLANGRPLALFTRDLSPRQPFTDSVRVPARIALHHLRLVVTDASGRECMVHAPRARSKSPDPAPATEPPSPESVRGNDELYLIGVHLEQYRHATRDPAPYWREALRRDPGDSRCHHALGRHCLRRGLFAEAETHLRQCIERQTLRNANPRDGEPLHDLGVVLAHLGRHDEAYDAFYKATWNHAWQSAGYHAIAEIDCRRHDWPRALDHIDRSLRCNTDNLRARNLRALILRRMDRAAEAGKLLRATRTLDPLDWWCRHLLGEPLACDTQTRIDLALDFTRAGFFADAIALLSDSPRDPGTAPLVAYHLAFLHERAGNAAEARRWRKAAAATPTDYCFPARLEEIPILAEAMRLNPRDARAPYYLGNLLYDRRRHEEAIRLWEQAARLDPRCAIVWRNLGIGHFNIRRQLRKARAAYERALRANPGDARLLYERDQLWKRLGEDPARRLKELQRHPSLVAERDDLAVELSALLNQTGQHAAALEILTSRRFQPWEGGEGQALGQFTRAHLALGRAHLAQGDAARAAAHFEQALQPPESLGEARHLLANQSDILHALGCARAALGDRAGARDPWERAARFRGDFQEMRVRSFSELTYYSALSLVRLGRKASAHRMLMDLLKHAQALAKAHASIDYFATSLPAMLLFDDDIQARQVTTARFLEAQAQLGLGNRTAARRLLRLVLQRDPAHAAAADLYREHFPS